MKNTSTHSQNEKDSADQGQGELLPELRFGEFEGEWDIKSLGRECNHISYGLTVRPAFVEKGIPLISAREITSGFLNIDKGPKISQEEFSKLSDKAKPKKGDIFLTKTGTIGISVRFMLDIPIAITQNIAVIRLDDINVNSPNYLIQYFKTRKFYRCAISRVNQSTIMDLQLGDIRKLLISFPSLPEQEKIASFLSAVDEKIQQLTKKKELLEQYKKGAMQQLFSGVLRFKNEDGEDYPEWEEKRLGEVGKIITGSTPPTSNPDYYDGEYLFVSPADINSSRYILSTKTSVTQLGFTKGREITKGSVLFVCIGSTIGKVAQAGADCITNQQINAIAALKDYSNEFIYSLLVLFGKRIKLLAGVQAVPQINKSDFSRFKFNFPSLREQQKIATFLSSIDIKIESVNKQITQTQSFKKGLLQQMFV